MITKALLSLRPGASWTCENDSYDKLVWLSDDQAKPSLEEVTAKIAELVAEQAATAYQRQRQPEYPSLTELADAIYWASTGDTTRIDAYYAACAAVKAKYPKPEVTP